MKKQIILCLLLLLSSLSFAQKTQVIAHRGYWTTVGADQNSRASVKNALDLGVYGCEIDIWQTSDGQLLLHHDASRDGVTLQESTYKQCKRLRLKNGERLPRLRDALRLLKKSKTPTKLIIEIKTHSTMVRNNSVVAATLKEVARQGMEKRVEYIAFSLDVCREIVRLAPTATVAYLNGDRSPRDLHAMGIAGIDYRYSVLRKHPEWIAEAHALGMTVNVWTVDKQQDMTEFRDKNVDFITTNEPVVCISICQ